MLSGLLNITLRVQVPKYKYIPRTTFAIYPIFGYIWVLWTLMGKIDEASEYGLWGRRPRPKCAMLAQQLHIKVGAILRVNIGFFIGTIILRP